jgi:hypothetical protein
VSHKKAPGAMSAMALMVSPVRPSVALLVEAPPPLGDGVFAFVSAFAITWFSAVGFCCSGFF